MHIARLSPEDIERIYKCRQPHTHLGFAYQLAFVRLYHRLPLQQPLEIVDTLLTYMSVQLDIPSSAIQAYVRQRRTIINHQQAICGYLNLRRFGETEVALLEAYLFEEACRLEQTEPLLVQVKSFLKENDILLPADSTLRRLILTQRQVAKEHIFTRITSRLSSDLLKRMDALLVAGSRRITPFQSLKQPPGRSSPKAALRLADEVVTRMIMLHPVDVRRGKTFEVLTYCVARDRLRLYRSLGILVPKPSFP